MDSVSSNIDSVTVETVSNIQRELDIYDIRSLVFLLYDEPYTALERLTLLQRVLRKDFDLLDDWAKKNGSNSNWKYEFLEALSICQLYGVIRNLGFDVNKVKLHFLPDNANVSVYVNPMKKILYKLCENLNMDNFMKFKNSLSSYDFDVREYTACELVLLELMCAKFIVLKRNFESDSAVQCQVENLTRIVENLPGMKQFAAEIREVEKLINKVDTVNKDETNNRVTTQIEVHQTENAADFYAGTFDNLDIPEDVFLTKLKTDTKSLKDEAYPIINSKRLGVCYIINQETFYPSKKSIEMAYENLEDRKGTTEDKRQLKATMESLNFQVIVQDNLKYDEISKNLNDVIKYGVQDKDSVFVLCILSHGIEGCFYSADSIPMKVKVVQNILDNDVKLVNKPKVMFIQACQGSLEGPARLVSDGPSTKHIRRADFLIYWATVPEYLAYRDEKKGSIFIQYLCYKIEKFISEEHLEDIFKRVNNSVIRFCEKHKCEQVPLCESTLRKKLYLKIPN